MNPQPTHEPRWQTRRLWCAQAGQCLDLAHRAGWPGFSCLECGDYHQQDVVPLWEANASARLLSAMISLPWLEQEKKWLEKRDRPWV